MVDDATAKPGAEVSLEKATDYAAIAGFGVLLMPGLVVDRVVVQAGDLPEPDGVARCIGR